MRTPSLSTTLANGVAPGPGGAPPVISPQELPRLEIEEATDTYVRAVAEPLARGLGTTTGNAPPPVPLIALPAPAGEAAGLPIGVIPLDAVFSPVRRVNYQVQPTRVGSESDLDRLILEIW